MYPAFEVLCHLCGIACKRACRFLTAPAALFFQRLGQVPVIQSYIRLDPGFQQSIHKGIVIGKAFLVPVCAAVGGNAGPCHGKAVGFQVHGLQQCKVLFPAVVAVAGNVTGLAPVGAARCVGKKHPRCSVPYRPLWHRLRSDRPLLQHPRQILLEIQP